MGMRFAVESWDPGYGTSGDDATLEPADQPVDATVELPLDQWRPVTPEGPAPESLLFVDGIQRIDTRIWIDDGPLSRPAICATVAAGAVHCTPGSAVVTAVAVERGLHTAVAEASAIDTRHGCYVVRRAGGDDDMPLFRSVHAMMTELECAISEELNGAEVVVFDGPLRGRDHVAGVGYVKTQHRQYLEPAQHRIIGDLGDGQRTPLFAIGGDFARWSWYLRLPGPRAHSLSGVVRLELPALGEAAAAAERADTISATLPRYASKPYKDARAPQNLYPIAGLERELRRRLGDSHLMERALRTASGLAAAAS